MTGSAEARIGDPWASSPVFRRGWLATSSPVDHDVANEWASVCAGALHFRVHPALSFAAVSDAGLAVTILGDAVDLDLGTSDGVPIARRALEHLSRGRDAAIRYAAYLGGRFAIVMEDDAGALVMPDCAGTLPIYWVQSQGNTILSSYVHLVGEVSGLPLDEIAAAYLPTAQKMETPRTLYVPGIRTPFEGVRPVLPNHMLVVDASAAHHKRFYPFSDTTLESDQDRSYDQFRAAFVAHSRVLSTWGRLGLSLTGGLDSRTALAALTPHLGEDAISWTYLNTKNVAKGMLEDASIASIMARTVGVDHHLVPLALSRDQEFADGYTRSFRHTQQFARVPHSYHDHLPDEIVEMQCMVAEIGTGFYKKREGSPTVERLAQLYCPFPFGKTEMVQSAWEEHLGYAPLPTDTAVDWHDLNYWESRIGRWGTLRMQEVDTAHHIVSPFNARAIVEALQGPPIAARSAKQALSRFVADVAPQLAGIPVAS